MKSKKIKRSTKVIELSNEPIEALRQIGEFLNENMILKGHHYPDGADDRSFEGYWQSVSFFYELMAIKHQCIDISQSAE